MIGFIDLGLGKGHPAGPGFLHQMDNLGQMQYINREINVVLRMSYRWGKFSLELQKGGTVTTLISEGTFAEVKAAFVWATYPIFPNYDPNDLKFISLGNIPACLLKKP